MLNIQLNQQEESTSIDRQAKNNSRAAEKTPNNRSSKLKN